MCSRLVALTLLFAVPALAAEPDAGSKPRVAVLYFKSASVDPELEAFSKGFASLILTDLIATDRVTVVERERLEDAMAELKLGESRFADKSSFGKIGKLLGAEYLVVGTLMSFRGQYKVTAYFWERETGQDLGQANVVMDPNDVFAAEQKVAALVTEQLVKRGAIAQVEIPAKKHALPYAVAAKYGKALDAKDKKDKATQKKLLTEVLQAQPEFKLAQADLLTLRD